MRFVLVSFFVVGCSRDLGIDKDVGVAPGDTAAIYDCSDLLDSCEKEACEACVDRCGTGCEVAEVSPMEFGCSDRQWTVYEFCPEWSEDDTGQQ